MPLPTTTISSLHERFYRIGSSVLSLTSPDFTESDRLKQFACAPAEPDLRAVIRVCSGPLLAAEETAEYAADGVHSAGGVFVRTEKDEKGTALWTARYTYGGSVSADFYTSSGISLTTFVITEILDLPRLLLAKGAVILHASFIIVDGRAVLFTAPKQTGKSTQAALWERYAGAKIINGDRALIELRDGVFHACGVPFSGTSGICHTGDYPILAVIALSQGKVNTCVPLTPRESLRALMTGCSFDPTDPVMTTQFLDSAEKIVSAVPFYSLSCLPDRSAVDHLSAALGLSF